MKTKQVINKNSAGFLAIALLMLLPSCALLDWVKDKLGMDKPTEQVQPIAQERAAAVTMPSDGSQVLVWMDNKPLITQESLETEKRELIESNPQLKAMIGMMDPKQLDRNLADGLTNRAIVSKYIIDNRIDQKVEYVKEYNRMLQSVKDMLNTKYFTEAFPAKVTDAEAKDFYEKNKDAIPTLLISRGGVNAMGAAFANEQDAQDFLNKVKAAKNDIKKAAKDAELGDKVKDFKLVHDQSLGINNKLREKIVGIRSFPMVEMYRIDDDAFWVVSATGKEEPKYKSFNEVKEDLKQMLEKEKTMEQFEKEVERLKKEYNIKLNEEYFKPEEAAAPVPVPEAPKPKAGKKGKKVADAGAAADAPQAEQPEAPPTQAQAV